MFSFVAFSFALIDWFDEYRLSMEEIVGSEWLVLIGMMINLLFAPCTKVEESFNVQATHDLVYASSLDEFDHHSYPGVVPRTFAGPIALSVLARPARYVMEWWALPKYWMLFMVRLSLGAALVIAFLRFARAVQRKFGRETAVFLRLVVASQFHFLFYSSRMLPNVFAMLFVLEVYTRWMDNRCESAVRWATTVAVLFRCELVLLFAPIFIPMMLDGRLSIGRALWTGVKSAVMTLVMTVPLDSVLWKRILWPELEVAMFNVIENRSGEYGTSPLMWYFYSALPRMMSSSIFLLPLGLLIDRRLPAFVLPVLVFVALYSLLPHKELRFVLYALPMLDLPAAVITARCYINRSKSWLRWLLCAGLCMHLVANVLTTSAFIYASARNYAGGDSLALLQHQMRMDERKPVSVHIDNYCAQNGVNRFLQLYDAWQYDKTENATVEYLQQFDFLLLGTHKDDLRKRIQPFYEKHRVMFVVPAFAGFGWNRVNRFPYYWPDMRFKERVAVMRKKD